MTPDNFQCSHCGRQDQDACPTTICKHLLAQPNQFWHDPPPTFEEGAAGYWPHAHCFQCEKAHVEAARDDDRLAVTRVLFQPDQLQVEERECTSGKDQSCKGKVCTGNACRVEQGQVGGYRIRSALSRVNKARHRTNLHHSTPIAMNDFKCSHCGRHDERTFPTVVCKHLAAQPKQFWHAGWPSAGPKHLDIWPDAWCKECDQKLIEDGGWEGRSNALNAAPESEREAIVLANLENDRQICNFCYEEGMASSMEAAEKQTLARWTPFVDECSQTLFEKQNRLEEQFSLSAHARWDVNQSTGQLAFSDGGEPSVVADVEFIGSYSTLTRTWLWAWANFDLPGNIRNRITSVQAFGNMHALPRLTIRKWRCSEEDTWKMAAVAAAVLEAQGVYRAQSRSGPVFMAIMNMQRLH